MSRIGMLEYGRTGIMEQWNVGIMGSASEWLYPHPSTVPSFQYPISSHSTIPIFQCVFGVRQ
jgi:hypothetical protein